MPVPMGSSPYAAMPQYGYGYGHAPPAQPGYAPAAYPYGYAPHAPPYAQAQPVAYAPPPADPTYDLRAQRAVVPGAPAPAPVATEPQRPQSQPPPRWNPARADLD